MAPLLAGKDASAGTARAGEYARHRPEQTLLYQLVEQYYPAFIEDLAARERTLPVHVQREFEDYLKCGRLEYGFLRVRCADCHAERLVAFSCTRIAEPKGARLTVDPSLTPGCEAGLTPGAVSLTPETQEDACPPDKPLERSRRPHWLPKFRRNPDITGCR